MTADAQLAVFGVRHLSPGGAWHLRRFLDDVQPRRVLIEGPADANVLIGDLLHPQTRPPVAVLAFSEALPVRSFVVPLARYSPEYQALRWAHEHRVPAQFIDLPSGIVLGLEEARQRRFEAELQDRFEAARAADEGDGPCPLADADDDDEALAEPLETPRPHLYDRLAELAGEPDYETYWERHFEHNPSPDSYRQAAFAFGAQLRELSEREAYDNALDLVREAHMRRCIRQTVAEGVDPERIAVVVGAYHAPVMGGEGLTDAELGRLPVLPSRLTLMPYSYFRLSSQSGYGAGNHAPLYFDRLWQCRQDDETGELPFQYLTEITRDQRRHGTWRSTAEVIEGVRLAHTLAALRGGSAPALADLRDAAMTLLGKGELAPLAESCSRVEVGTAVGKLPAGVSQTSIQHDFAEQLRRLNLSDYHANVKRELVLDLRENRDRKSEEAAFRDLHRSQFLHRLLTLGIGFGEKQDSRQEGANWKEVWHLQWTPEMEISLVESVLLGETVELACAYRFHEALEACEGVQGAASLVARAGECGMLEVMRAARARLQELAAVSAEVPPLAEAASGLATVIRYGDVRRLETAPLLPLLAQMFLAATLQLAEAADCDNDAAKLVLEAMGRLDRVSLDYTDLVDEPRWLRELAGLAARDDRNPLLSGYACGVLLERGRLPAEELAREVSRRLSPGIEADLGAGWFEGLSMRNRPALLRLMPLWEQLADYVASLDDAEFRRALVFLRRSFGTYSPAEKRQIAENLGEAWGVSAESASEVLSGELSAEEEESLADLEDFDFDDL